MAYDAAKAHEYYIKYRKKGLLKGRQSKKGLSEYGKSTASMLKEELNAQRKAEYDAITKEFNEKIKALRKRMKGADKEKLKREIEALRAEAKERKAAVRDKYDEKYAQAIEGLRKDSSMVAPSKQKKSTSAKKSGGRKPSGSRQRAASSGKVKAQQVSEQSSVDEGMSDEELELETERLRNNVSDIINVLWEELGRISPDDEDAKAALKQKIERARENYRAGLEALRKRQRRGGA